MNRVQVQAISMFRESRLKSDKAGLFITTFSFQKHHDRSDLQFFQKYFTFLCIFWLN